MAHDLIDVSDLPQPFIEAIQAAIRAYRERTEPRRAQSRTIGWASGVLPPLPDSFFDALPEDILDLFDGKPA